ncbi:MAG: tRNA (guanine37-N1)-methyltransferase [Lysobacterales bacterium]|jgi:tRNA (guanine37-N1)-methyltransferase
MRFDVITIFPNMFGPVINDSIIKRAQESKKVRIELHDLREYSTDKHKKVDDRPFGGGAGMLMTAQPFFDAIKKIKGRRKAKVIMPSPTGKPLTQRIVKRLAKERNLIIICGHYEGIDDRVRSELVDESISIGDYVLTGGEIPAMVLIDSVSRLIPGVLGKYASLDDESFENNLLEYPQYTRPADFRGIKVPSVVLSGHHKKISDWQKDQAHKRTKRNRPDLLDK